MKWTKTKRNNRQKNSWELCIRELLNFKITVPSVLSCIKDRQF